MSKSADAFRTISEVAEWLDTPAHVLRFWESKFSQIKPVKRAGGRRYYRPADMMLVGGIKKLLHDDGLTIKGAQKILREQGVKHVAALSIALDDEIDIIDADPNPATSADEMSDLALVDGEPDLSNVTIEVPLADEDSDATILQFQPENPPAQEDDTGTAESKPAPEMGTIVETVIDTVPDPVGEPELETKPEIVTQSDETDPTLVSDSISPSITDSAPVETHAPEIISEPTEDTNQPNTDQTTDSLADTQPDLIPELPSEPHPDAPACEPELATEDSVENDGAPSMKLEAAPEEHTETTSGAVPDSSAGSEIAPEITSVSPVDDTASDLSFTPSFSHRAIPEVAAELPLERSETPQDTAQTEAAEEENLSSTIDLVEPPVSGIEPDTSIESTAQTAPAPEPKIEGDVPPPPQPNEISVPDDPTDDMAEDPANSAAAAHILAILAAKSDGVNTTQKAELVPLLDRLEVLQTKMLAQHRD